MALKYICPHCGVEMTAVFCDCAEITGIHVYIGEDGHKYHARCGLRIRPDQEALYTGSEKRERARQDYERFEKDLVEYWNQFVGKHPDLAAVLKISDVRRKHIKARYESAHYREHIKKAIDRIERSPFLLGKSTTPWHISFDFLIGNDANYIKILEGKYEDRDKAAGIHKFIQP